MIYVSALQLAVHFIAMRKFSVSMPQSYQIYTIGLM